MASASLWIYRLLLGGLLPIALPAIKIRQWLSGKSRPRFRDRFARSLPILPEAGIWIQAVSVGEVGTGLVEDRIVATGTLRPPEMIQLVAAFVRRI